MFVTVIAAWMIASQKKLKRNWGFWLFLLSNLLWIAWALYDGALSGLGSDVFTLTISPPMIGTALLWAIAVAVLGGIAPSIRAARWTVSEALRVR